MGSHTPAPVAMLLLSRTRRTAARGGRARVHCEQAGLRVDFATLIGLVAGVGIIGLAMLSGGELSTFADVPGLLIVIGGTFASTLIKFSLRDSMRALPAALKRAFLSGTDNPRDLALEAHRLADIVRRGNLLALENETIDNIDRITGDGSDRFYWDDDLPGFGLRVRASGRKYYVVQFRANGRLRRMTLGRHGAITPETARRRAMALISEAKGGKDPAALRDKGRKAATMKVLGKRFLEEYVPVHCKPSTAYEYRRSVKFFIDPRIGTRKVTEIQRSDIAELHHGMRETPYQANRTLGVLSKMFNLAELWGLRPDGSNPCLHVKRYKEEKRERFLSAEEFTRLGQVLDEILKDGSETRSAVAAIRLLMLTGCRLSEIQKLRWEHVDLDAGELRLPDTKTGGRAVPLAPSAVRLLTSLPHDEDNPWVIAGRKPDWHLTDLQHPWRRIRARAGLDGVRIHDLRHSFASRALALGEGLPMIGKLLGHTQVQTTARYAHLARDTVKASAARIGDSIDRDLDAAE